MMTVKPRTNLALDTIILGLFVVVLVSGLLLWVVYPSGGTRARGRGQARALTAESDSVEILGFDKHAMVTLHNWIGLGMGVLVVVHLVFHWKWITCQVKRLFRRRSARSCPDE